MKRFARWFTARRQLLAELHNLERAVRDHQHKQTLILAALDEMNAKLQQTSAKLTGAVDQITTNALMLTLFGTAGHNNGN